MGGPIHKSVSGGSASEWIVPSDSAMQSQESLSQSQENVTSTPVSSTTKNVQGPVKSALPPVAFNLLGSENLPGIDARDLAIQLASDNNLPMRLLSIIANSDTNDTSANDNLDLYGEYPLKSYTSPKFHPGRVMLVGDAGHTLCVGAHGSHGASISINDSVLLAKLIGFHFASASGNSVRTDSGDSERLEKVSSEFCRLRLEGSNKALSDARAEAKWVKPEGGVWKLLFGVGSWNREAFDQMVLRGFYGNDSDGWPRFDSP